MKSVIVSFSFLFLFNLQTVLSQWSDDTKINLPICTDTSSQFSPQIITDGGDGAIIFWTDSRNSMGIYAQKIDSSGFAKWETNGIPIPPGNQLDYQVIPDSEGGAFIAWIEFSDSSIHVQHINSSGLTLWDTNGILVRNKETPLENPKLISDGKKGIIVLWEDNKSNLAGITGIYVQRINPQGTLMWDINGVAVCTSPYPEPLQTFPIIIPDSNGGAIIGYREGGFLSIQRVDESGNILWENGQHLCLNLGYAATMTLESIVSINDNEFVAVWNSLKYPSTIFEKTFTDIYAQKFDKTGNILWNEKGIPICTADGSQNETQAIFDNDSSVVITWTDKRNVFPNVFCQKLDRSGNIYWSQNGIYVGSHISYKPKIALSKESFIIIWISSNLSLDIYAQQLSRNGSCSYPSGGTAICNADGTQNNASLISASNENTIVVWEDSRNNPDIYAQNIRYVPTGIMNDFPHQPNTFILFQNYPNPFNPTTVISYQLPVNSKVTLKVYDILGREITTIVNEEKSAGSYEVEFYAANLPSGVYFYILEAGSKIFTKKLLLLK
jgi:hypothetical protein